MTRLRVLLYCVTRVGIGHFVRTREIARATGACHDAYLVDDGAPVPDRAMHRSIPRIRIPSVLREGGLIVPASSDQSLSATLSERADRLVQAVRRIRPDVLLLEHFPFSKLEHRDEILSMINAAREINPDLLVLCSIRDLAPEPNYRHVDAGYRQTVLDLLHQFFDGILVHSDERFARLEDSLSWADAIRLPLGYTGFVAEPLTLQADESTLNHASAPPGLILVSGGGRRDASLYKACQEAWCELRRRGTTGGREMVLIAPAGIDANTILGPSENDCFDDLRMETFSPSLVNRMLNADLSISHAGYNTCTNFLTTKTRSILIPHQDSADQVQRAQRLARLGLTRILQADALQPARIADAIEQQLVSAMPSHDFRLDGAERSVSMIENWFLRKKANAL